MANVIEDIRSTAIASAYIELPFDKAKEALENAGYKIITAEENAKLRIEEGKDASISQNGNYVREGVLYVPNRGGFITRGSLAMTYPEEATYYHRNDKKFYITPAEAESILSDSIIIPYNKSAIPTDRFKDDEITNFVFKEFAEKYGLFLKDAGMKQLRLSFDGENSVNSEKKPYANQLWMHMLGDDSGIYGSWSLYDGKGVRGVRESGDAEDSKKISSLESNILNALSMKKPFKHNGTIYVPVADKEL